MQDSKYVDYLRSDKWRRIAKERMAIDGFKCCMCASCGTPDNPLQVHHLTYYHLYREDEEDYLFTDLMTLCGICHKALHRAMERITSPDGRRGWKNARIPQTHVFTLSGDDVNAVISNGKEQLE